MERLTKRINGKAAFHECASTCGTCQGTLCGSVFLMADRLAAYEDTGLEPEEVTAIKCALMGREVAKITEFEGVPIRRLQELAQAEKDGRLVVLPCKVGDTVYRVLTTRDTDPIVTEIEIKTLAQAIELIGKIGEHKVLSWYLTREEAEAALKKREADNETD